MAICHFWRTCSARLAGILDVACGAGRHSLPLARARVRRHRGRFVDGVSRRGAAACRRSVSITVASRRYARSFRGASASTARSVSATASATAIAKGRAHSSASLAASLKPAPRLCSSNRRDCGVAPPDAADAPVDGSGDILFFSATARHHGQPLDVDYSFLRGAVRETARRTRGSTRSANCEPLRAGLFVEQLCSSPTGDPHCLGDPRLLL